MGLRPTYCPFCTKDVEEVRPHDVPVPPDKRDDYPPQVRMSESPGTAQKQTHETIEAVQMQPCGHVFRRCDIELLCADEEPLQEIAPRVLNPGRE